MARSAWCHVDGGALGGSHGSPTDAYAYAAERLSLSSILLNRKRERWNAEPT